MAKKGKFFLNGFTSPSAQTFTAGQATRSVSMVYEALPLGVYIQGVSGKLYSTYLQWVGKEEANGVALITENCQIVIAKENYDEQLALGSNAVLINNIVTTTQKDVSIADFEGEYNTEQIISQLKGIEAYDGGPTGSPAAEYCKNYIFPNGKNGYLGAAGEWELIRENRSSINSLLSDIGSSLGTSTYWTSTQYDTEFMYCTGLDSYGATNRQNKIVSQYVRPICKL